MASNRIGKINPPAVRKQLTSAQLFPVKLAFLLCATAPPMLTDFGMDKVQCMILAFLSGMVIPAAVARFVCKSSIKDAISACLMGTIGCAVLSALILSAAQGPISKFLVHYLHIPLMVLIVVACWTPIFCIEWLIYALWDANGVGVLARTSNTALLNHSKSCNLETVQSDDASIDSDNRL